MFNLNSPYLSRIGLILLYSLVFLPVGIGVVMFFYEILIPLWYQLTNDAVNLITPMPH